MTRKLKISVGEATQGARQFVEQWRAMESGDTPETPAELLVFEDLETLLRYLTPARWRLLKSLRSTGPSSVRAISRITKRDYKSVHTDVRLLESIGLIGRTEDGLVVVPWDAVTAELLLAA
jgi:predicted transcriptional regulator